RLMDATPVPCGQSAITAKRSNLYGWAGYGYCPSHSRWYWGSKLLIICTCGGTVTGFGLANPKLFGEREQARQMLTAQPATPTAAASPLGCGPASCSGCSPSTPPSGTTGRSEHPSSAPSSPTITSDQPTFPG